MKSSQGMSLIEILIVLVIMGMIVGFVGGKVFDRLEEGKIDSAKIQINMLSERLKEFRRSCGQYPTTEQGLESLVVKPTKGKTCDRYPPNGFLDKEVPKDPWQSDYVYQSDGNDFNITSYGRDRLEGGESFDADIHYKDPKKK